MDFVENVKDGTVTITIEDFDRMRTLLEKEKEQLNEEIKAFEKSKEELKKEIDEGFVKILIYKSRYDIIPEKIRYVSKDEALEKAIQSKKEIIARDAENEEKRKFYKMNVFQFLKWKRVSKKHRKNWTF